jgi:hypothetical protein
MMKPLTSGSDQPQVSHHPKLGYTLSAEGAH